MPSRRFLPFGLSIHQSPKRSGERPRTITIVVIVAEKDHAINVNNVSTPVIIMLVVLSDAGARKLGTSGGED